MNPRAFCREGTYETALFLTYSFDPLFFERIVLPDLWMGGTNECLVVADHDALEEALPRAVGQVHHLGRRYRLMTPLENTRQHAKLILRAGPSGALVWVGSGNLTCGGWGDNRELATAWRIDPSDKQGVALFTTLLAGIVPLLHGGAEQVGQKLLDLPWVPGETQRIQTDYSFLLSQQGDPLSKQLARRWEGRKFHTLKVLTGSTDNRGAFLEWAAHTFGVKKVIIGLDPDSSDFEPKRLKKLPMEVRIVPLPASPRPHSKFYFFEGKKDFGAIVGSANCSAAAWLTPLESGGNTELVVAYEHCDRNDFGAILELLQSGGDITPEKALTRAKEMDDDEHGSDEPVCIRISEFAISGTMGDLRLVIEHRKSGVIHVMAYFGDLESPLRAIDKEGRVFVGKYPDLPEISGTHFAHIVFKFDDGRTYTIMRWLDEEDELAQSSIRHRIKSIERLAASTKPSEQRQIIEDISEVAKALFSRGEFPDPSFSSDKSDEEEETVSPAVDPHQLVRSISQISEQHSGLPSKRIGSGLSLQGIMRILFQTERDFDEENIDEEDEEKILTDTDDDWEDEDLGKTQAEEPAESFKRRLFKTIEEDFIKHVIEPKFLMTCTATQLSQAIAFPLAVAVRGLEGGWIDNSTALSWSIRVLDLLFNTRIEYKDAPPSKGALALLEQRYARERRLSTLEKVLGNGILWSALVVNLTQLEWDETDRFLAKALYLRDLFDAPILYAQADPEALFNMIRGYRGHGTAKKLLGEAEKTARRVKKLEKCICDEFDVLCQKQMGLRHEPGDLVYRPKAGFGWIEDGVQIASTSKVFIYLRRNGDVGTFRCDWYCNVRLAANNSKAIAKLLVNVDKEGVLSSQSE